MRTHGDDYRACLPRRSQSDSKGEEDDEEDEEQRLSQARKRERDTKKGRRDEGRDAKSEGASLAKRNPETPGPVAKCYLFL